MADLSIELVAEIDDRPSTKIDHRSTPLTVTLTADEIYHVEDIVVADNYGTVTLWQTGIGGMDDFDFGMIVSDQDIYIEMRNDLGTPEYTLMLVKANVPYFFGGENGAGTTERLDGADLVEDTDHATVDQIKVQRDAADNSGDATVDLWLWK